MIVLLVLVFLMQERTAGGFQVLLQEGRGALERKDYSEALEKLSRAEEIDRASPACLNLLGLAYFQLMEHAKAKSYLERSLEIDQANPYTWTLLGHVFYQEGRFQDAVENYRRALSLEPGYPQAAQFLDELALLGKALRESRKRHLSLLFFLLAEILATGILFFFLYRISGKDLPRRI